jgi:hypothetical protein
MFIGVPVILAGLLAGPTRTATRLRRLMAPYLSDRPDITFGALALLLLLLFAWGPIVATRTLTGIAIVIVLAVFGTEMLRRQTALEFPDAHVAVAPPPPGPPGPAGPTGPAGPVSPGPTTSPAPPSSPSPPPSPDPPDPPPPPDDPGRPGPPLP